jgi:hypothetical protein
MQVIVGAFDERVPLAGFDDEHSAGWPPDPLAVDLGETVASRYQVDLVHLVVAVRARAVDHPLAL